MEPNIPNTEGYTFEKVWFMFQQMNAETNKKFEETNRKFEEQNASLTKKFEETDRRINECKSMLSGMGINIGESAERYFFSALESRSELWGIKYEHVDEFHRRTKTLEGQYDIVLFNGDTIIIVEVKQKVHPKDIPDLIERRIPNFRILFPEYAHKKIVGCLAGLVVPEDVHQQAEEAGLLVLTQQNEDIAILNAADFKPKIL